MSRYSVIIPLYNKEKHIQRAIKSVLNQKYNDFELIIVDDASSDNSLQKACSVSDSRIMIIESDSNNALGSHFTRNRGIEASSSEWISFLDADDEWMPEYLSTIEELRSRYPEAKIFSTAWLDKYSDDNIVENKFYLEHKNSDFLVYDRKAFLEYSISGVRPVCTSVATVHKESFLSIGAFPAGKGNRGEDLAAWLRMIMEYNSGGWSSRICAIYHRDSNNMVTKTSSPHLRNNYLIKAINDYQQNNKDDELKQLLQKYKRIIYRNIIKDKLDICIIKMITGIFGKKYGEQLLTYLVKQKKSLLNETG